jgi:hypothetical protein
LAIELPSTVATALPGTPPQAATVALTPRRAQALRMRRDALFIEC